MYEKEVKEGKWTPKGRDDILARAIGKKENRGRVRGVSSYIGVAKYFGETGTKDGDDSEKVKIIYIPYIIYST